MSLNTGVQITFSPNLAEGLPAASSKDLALVEISPAGLGLHWPKLGADVCVPALLQGVFGSTRWMATKPHRGGSNSRREVSAPRRH